MPPIRDSNGAVIPRAKRNADGEDISRAVVPSARRRPGASTSSKAIIQRHGRHGIWGDGQMSFIRKLSGQEKLALKAEEIMSTAMSPSFKLSELQTIAESELITALDLISDLHDPDFFHEDISNLIASRPKLKPDLLTAPFVGKIISSRIHNAYLWAASWKVVSNVLQELKARDLQDPNVRKQLVNSVHMRDAYLLVVDTIAMLCNLAQQELSLAVVGSNELGSLFTSNKNSKTFSTVDSANVMAAHRSLIDTVIIELVLPQSKYEPHILVAVLRDAVDTTPKEESKKFSQAVFDALGILSLLVDFQNMLLGPLYGEQGENWLKAPRKEAAGEIDEFFDAIAQSLNASNLYSRWQAWAFPLRKLKSKAQLDDLWNQINTVYVEATGHSIDTLWRLDNDLQRKPQYSTWYIPDFAMYASDIESDDEYKFPPGLSAKSKKKAKDALVRAKRQHEGKATSSSRKAIRNDDDDDDEYDDDMPSLKSVSSSSDESNGGFGPSNSEDEDEEEDDSDAEESDWEGNERRTMNALLADAMREFQKRGGKLPSYDDDKGGSSKVNPFLRMLKEFSGRVFNTDPTFRPQKLGEKPVFGPPRPPPEPAKPKGTPSSAPKPQTTGMTVEDTEDEDDVKADDKKKKKKKKKKPKKKTTAEEGEEIKEALDSVETPVTSPQPPTTNPASPTSPPTKPAKAPSRRSTDIGGSTISLPTANVPTAARSAHSYLGGKEAEPKVKVKTRADPGAAKAEDKSKGFFSKYTTKGKERKEKDRKREEEEMVKAEPTAETQDKDPKEKRGVFQLTKKATKLFGRIFGTKDDEAAGQAGIRWEQFEKAMKKMGFTVKHSSQGSRVTFFPPNPKDPSVVFHKPHPDPTINPVRLKQMRKTLQAHYGWEADHFMEQLAASAGLSFDDNLD